MSMQLLLRCFTIGNNSSLKKLNISKAGKEIPAAEELACMIASNRSLLHLDVSHDTRKEYPSEDTFYSSKDGFTGRRRDCADQQRTFLTDDFFPRLQVVLHNHACAENWVAYTDTCVLELNLFSIVINGGGVQ